MRTRTSHRAGRSDLLTKREAILVYDELETVFINRRSLHLFLTFR
jgi:hypothetical protein